MMRMLTPPYLFAFILAAGLVVGCGGEEDNARGPAGGALPEGLVVEASPGDATPVQTLKDTAKVGDDVVVRGRIGGAVDPFADGFAVFSIVDHTEPMSCGPDHCKTPWDYCCTPGDQLTRAMASVQIVDDDGRPLEGNVVGVQGLEPNRMVTVKGTVAEVVQGRSLVVNADAIHVAPPSDHTGPHAGHNHDHGGT